MTKFGGNNFVDFSVPLTFLGRYFILEPGDPTARLTVIVENEGRVVYEILRNTPVVNDTTSVVSNPSGVVTVTDLATGKFLYKVRPGSETSIVFGTLKRDGIEARITDRNISAGGMTVQNCTFNGSMTALTVFEDGTVALGSRIPQTVLVAMGYRATQ